MRRYVVDYLKDRPGPRPGTLVERGYRLLDTPRLMPLCRLFGHRAVVDGTANTSWVCCDRCGVRPEPQGSLDPRRWNIGDRYTGPWGDALPADPREQRAAVRALKDAATYPPGPWPRRPTGEVGAHLVLGRSFGGAGVEFQIGCGGEERTLSASLRLHHLGALHLHAARHGTWLQRRFNRTGYDNRVTEIRLAHNGLRWRLWAPAGRAATGLPRWRDGSVCLDPREWLFGELGTRVEHVGVPEEATVRMPHGDDHDVVLQLQRCTTGRPRGRRREHVWVVDWACAEGIPCRHDDGWTGGAINASEVEVSDSSAEDGSWPQEAVAAIATQMTRDRARHGYHRSDAPG